MTKNTKRWQEFKQKRPGFYSGKELAIWLGVSRNSIPDVAERFRITSIEGLYPEADVWRRILMISPRHEDDRRLLRKPLQGSVWLARRTGVPSSTVRAKIRKGTFEYPRGVQLSEAKEDGGPPRSRRWIPCIIEALADGRQPPEFEYVERVDASCFFEKNGAKKPVHLIANNVFAQIVHDKAEIAQQ
ncbi:hypothetical protein ACOI1H_22290 [Loktanella sp. DJP18]|uniref:hypothetical protein n=1 Tax=Loktanella sp. DJP18 TaxID=3409788 RepID=UPI003BB4B87F